MALAEIPLPNGKFRYTPGTEDKTNRRGLLNNEQREFYEVNGFVVIPKLVPDALLDECHTRFLDVVHDRVERGGILMMKDVSLKDREGVDPERIVNKLQDIAYDDTFSKYILFPEMLDVVENFTGPNITASHTMLINKPPDSGSLTSRHPVHQDLHYFPFRPANRIVASWTAMERIDDRNGCLIVYPGSHDEGNLRRHEYPEWEGGVNKMYHGVRGMEDRTPVELHMDKGDTVFFHPLLVHGSGPNKSSRFRKAISTHYAASGCSYIDVTGTSQQSIADEVEAIAKKRGLSDAKYSDIWQLRARPARGLKGNL